MTKKLQSLAQNFKFWSPKTCSFPGATSPPKQKQMVQRWTSRTFGLLGVQFLLYNFPVFESIMEQLLLNIFMNLKWLFFCLYVQLLISSFLQIRKWNQFKKPKQPQTSRLYCCIINRKAVSESSNHKLSWPEKIIIKCLKIWCQRLPKHRGRWQGTGPLIIKPG